MNGNLLKKVIAGIAVFIACWVLCVIFVFVAVILISFALRNHPSMNLEMGWMAVIILVPPFIGTILSIPLSIILIKKINRKI
jgi:high-affinity K+ transport system ATPase subunit B